MASNMVWVWSPVVESKVVPFRHPADIPAEDEATAKQVFIECLRGPRTARISPVTMLQQKGTVCLIAEKGATREVPKYMILPWYEGLLILEELEAVQGKEGHIPASWWDVELQGLLSKERGKSQSGRLNGTLYAEKRLLHSCVTGKRFEDSDSKEYSYRRDNIKPDATLELDVDGEEKDGDFKVKEITNYLPPWEAFLSDRCGFYQDFYLVKWAYPFSEVDYSRVENGCPAVTGATWEPDECIPAHLDILRVQAKRAWIKRRRADELKAPSGGSPPATGVKKEKPDEPVGPPVKMARVRADGKPLDRDLMRAMCGHDFIPDAAQQSLAQIRSGWPKTPQDYPKGFAVASPPGFCLTDCDCMDDQRPQRSWETRKGWLEDSSRNAAAHSALNAFSEQTRFVRRRGQVSKMCFFETAQTAQPDPARERAALDLAHSASEVIRSVLMQIPAASLVTDGDAVCIPGRVFLPSDKDYDALQCTAQSVGGMELPAWLRMEPDTGRLMATKAPAAGDLPLNLQVDFHVAEGFCASGTCQIIGERFQPAQAPWLVQTGPIAVRYSDPARCPLEQGVRGALLEHFSELYDFGRRQAREKSLGEWLDGMVRILRLLRAAGGASLAFAPESWTKKPEPEPPQPQEWKDNSSWSKW